MMDVPSVQRIAELQQLIANFAKVKRTNKLADNQGLENDVEHSFGLALTCWFLAPHIAPELNLQKILQYALVHDLVELYAGDTYFLVTPEMAKEKKAREHKAAQRLDREWAADFPELTETIENYENKVDEETWFVYAVDKILPPIMIHLHEKEAYYQRMQLTKAALFETKYKTLSKSKHMQVYIERYLAWLEDGDYFYNPAD